MNVGDLDRQKSDAQKKKIEWDSKAQETVQEIKKSEYRRADATNKIETLRRRLHQATSNGAKKLLLLKNR
jgi:hypothetical protein